MAGRGNGGGNSTKIGISMSMSGSGAGNQKCSATILMNNGNKSTGGGGSSGGKGGGGGGGRNPRKCGSCSTLAQVPKRKVTVTMEDYGSPSSKVVQVPSVMRAMGMMVGREAVQSRAHEKVSKASFENKKNGCYSHLTTEEKVYRKDFIDFHSGRVGSKKEVQVTSTLKFGDKSKGYSGQFVTQQKSKKVNY